MNTENSRTVVIFCNNFSMGGTETLILRLLKWYSTNNCRSILLTMNPIVNDSILKDIAEIDFEHYVYDGKSGFFFNSNNELSFINGENPLVITQFFPEFFKCFTLLSDSKYKVKFTHTIYIVHPFSTYLISKKMIFLGKYMIDVFLRKKHLIFMDEVCVKACINYYKLDDKKYVFEIFRLPVFIKKASGNNASVRNHIFNVLTILRFEFPFKGYVIGLIKSFSDLFKINNNITLTIIGYGEGKPEVDELIKTLPFETAGAISVNDQMPTHLVNDYIQKCDIYIGMGTTVLDGANNNKVVITAAAYQKSDYAIGFFHETYHSVGEIFDAEIHHHTIKELLLKVINADSNEFNVMAAASKSALIQHYNIETIAQKLLFHSNFSFNRHDRLIVTILAYMNLMGMWIVKKLNLDKK